MYNLQWFPNGQPDYGAGKAEGEGRQEASRATEEDLETANRERNQDSRDTMG